MDNKEQRLALKFDKPDFLVMSGSRLYGTQTIDSDYDYRGFVVPPFEYLAGLGSFDAHISQDPDDIVIYSLKKFFQLLIKGDPTVCEILFAPECNISYRNDIGGIILRNKHIFVSKKVARRTRGYAESEWRKVTGTQLLPTKRTPTEDSVINDIRSVFKLDKENMDEVIKIMFSNHPREIRSAKRKLGYKRKEQVERYGYCTSSACHTIRLLGQLIELLDTGTITFPRPNRQLLSSIKHGEIPLESVTEIYKELCQQAQVSEQTTKIREKPDIKQIEQLYNEIIANQILLDQIPERYRDQCVNRWLKFS